MRARGGFVVGLVVVVVSVAAWLSVAAWRDHTDQRNLAAAVALAHRVPPPEGAVPSNACRGDGLVSCWTTPAQPRAAADSVAASLRRLGGHVTVACDRVRVGSGSAARSADECHVAARFGSRAVTVFADPHWQHGPGGNTIDGSLISVAAA
jgi:hypothetical protein